MSFPRYAEYKPSGVEWLGEVPAHWHVSPCRAFVTERSTKNEDAANQNYLSLMANVGVIPYEEKGDVGNKKPEDLSKCKLVEVGDFVINSMNYGIGSYGLSPFKGVCSSVYIVLTPKLEVVEPRYAHRIFEDRAFQGQAQSFGNGILEHRAAINWDILKGMRVALPPLNEQRLLLAFLDRETAKIDALVAEQQKLIALLKEKRQAVISHAVTKGLNPHAPMKPSGIEWLGDVPAHWRVSRLGRYISVLSGFAFPSGGFSDDDSDVRLLRGINVGVGRLKWDETVYWARAENDGLDNFQLRDGQIVVGMDRPWIGEGMRVARVTTNDLPCLLLQRVTALTPSPEIAEAFVYCLLSTEMFANYLAPEITGVSVPHISPSQIADFVVPVPSVTEQLAIVSFLDRELQKVDGMALESEQAITLLKERRSALISAAVTGQIDVRGLTSKAVAEAPAGAVL